MTIEQPHCFQALDICHASPSQCLEDEMMPAFRRTCSAPGCLSTSAQNNVDIDRSTYPRSAHDQASFALSGSTSELRHIRALHDSKLIKSDDYPCTFSRSRSCGFEDISSFVRTIKDQDAIISSNCDSHGDTCLNGVCGCACITSNCSLNDATHEDTSCLSCLTAHDAAAIGVDMPSHRPMDSLELVTWNLASPNNNPFEFWVTLAAENTEYVSLMRGVELVMSNPGSRDVPVSCIFTHDMFLDLRQELADQGMGGLDALEQVWRGDYMRRRAVSEFLRDKSVGSKRLVSMPDRITNTIVEASGASMTRPSPISASQADIGTVERWWAEWRRYMFHTEASLVGKHGRPRKLKAVCALLEPISRSKYPDLSEEEERISLPLQVLCLAIFDAVLVHVLHAVAPDSWQGVKHAVHTALYANRAAACVSILQRSYGDADAVCLQEVSGALAERLRDALPRFALIAPAALDRVRNQNSLILLRRSRFDAASARDVTHELTAILGTPSMLAPGDLVVATVSCHAGCGYLVASMHSDSCGLATTPVLAALHHLAATRYPTHRLLLGIDANTFSDPSRPDPGPAAPGSRGGFCRTRSCPDVMDLRRTASACPVNSAASFHSFFSGLGLASCWGDEGHLTAWTTCMARTFLQPQLQKAVGLADALGANHCHLKDWILFYEDHFTASPARLDNTGARHFAQRVFPAQDFPSDHAAVAVRLTPRPAPCRPKWP